MTAGTRHWRALVAMAQTDPLGDLESGSHPLPEQPPGAAAAAPPQRQLLASGHGGTLSPHGALPGSPRC